jgi:hypothetical protein
VLQELQGVVMKSLCMQKVLFAVLIATIIIVACGESKGPEKEKPMTQKKQLVGAWKFLSMTAKKPNGEVIYPYGEDLYGMLVYTASGHMSFLGMRRDRPQFASDDPFDGTDEEIKAAFEGFDAYCGTYEVDTEKSIIIHHVEASRLPGWMGTDQIRHFRFDGERLMLTASFPVKGEMWNLEAVLQRL